MDKQVNHQWSLIQQQKEHASDPSATWMNLNILSRSSQVCGIPEQAKPICDAVDKEAHLFFFSVSSLSDGIHFFASLPVLHSIDCFDHRAEGICISTSKDWQLTLLASWDPPTMM